MPVGKLAAQVAHASMSFISRGLIRPVRMMPGDPFLVGESWYAGYNDPITVEERKLIVDVELAEWLDGPFTKIVLAAADEAELLSAYNDAKSKGLRVSLICDEGRTVFGGVPTNTCIAIGPNYVEKVDSVARRFPLYK